MFMLVVCLWQKVIASTIALAWFKMLAETNLRLFFI